MGNPDISRGGPKPSEAQWRIGESWRRAHDRQELASLRAGSVSSKEIADAPDADVVRINLDGRRIVFTFTPGAQTAEVPTDAFCSEASLQAVGVQLDRTARALDSAVPGVARRNRPLSLERLVAHEAAIEASDVAEEWAAYGVGKADQG